MAVLEPIMTKGPVVKIIPNQPLHQRLNELWTFQSLRAVFTGVCSWGSLNYLGFQGITEAEARQREIFRDLYI